MDQNINSVSSIPDNHKKKMMALAALGFIGVLIVIVVLVSFFSKPGSTNRQQIVRNGTVVQVTPVGGNQRQMYSSDLFEIQYPSMWRAEDYAFENGSGVMFLPATLPAGVLSPKVSVEVVPTSSLSLDNRIASFRSNRFAEEPYRSGEIVGYKFSHVLPFKPARDQIINTPIQENFIVFESGGNLFTVGYEYDQQGGEQAKKLEEEILATFKLR